MNFLNDVGYLEQCEAQIGSSYVQISIGLTNLPLIIPLSVCLPKACGDGAVFLKLLATLQYKGNKILDFLKTIVDFDHTRDSIPSGLDQALLR